ncbi:hypothetical protein PSAC2689_100050 [Paraburkholderia sacchari]
MIGFVSPVVGPVHEAFLCIGYGGPHFSHLLSVRCAEGVLTAGRTRKTVCRAPKPPYQ